MSQSDNYNLQILLHIAENPDTTQNHIAVQLGVAVGSVNWYMKRLIKKGYIKVTKMQRRRLRYLLTLDGLTEKNRLMREYMRASLKWYRLTREDSKRYLAEITSAGYTAVYVEGDGDLAEIVYLTCLEAGVKVKANPNGALPVIRIENWRTVVEWPGG